MSLITSLGARRAGPSLGAPASRAALFDALASFTPVGVLVTGVDGGCEFVNERWCELAGLSFEQALGDGWQAALHPDDAGRVLAEWSEAAAAGHSFRVSYRMVRPDRRVSWIDASVSAVRDKRGHLAGWVGSCLDVTERRESREEAMGSLSLLDALQSTAPVGFALVDREFRIVRINPALAAINGGTVEEKLGLTLADSIPDLWSELEPLYRQVLERGETVVHREILGLGDSQTGDARYLLTSMYPVRVEGEIVAAGVVIVDITEQELAEQARRRSDERYKQLFEQANDPIYTADLEGRFVSINPAAERLIGYTNEEVTQLGLFDLIVPEDKEQAAEILRDRFAGGTEDRLVEVRLVCKDGRRVAVEVAGRLVEEDGVPVGMQGIARDVTERNALQEQLRHQAFHDTLTGLPNRALVHDRAEQMLARARRQHSPVAVLYLDIDGLKDVNDTFGHAAGDALLKEVAARLASVVRDGDTVGRMSGDEFLVLLDSEPNTSPVLVAERILDLLHQPIDLNGTGVRPVSITASVGIAVGQRASADELIRDADIALYRAKESGRDRYTLFEASMHETISDRVTLELDLHEALDEQQFFLLYQPTFDLQRQTMTGVEALIRWRHPSRGVLAPDLFIPIAEQNDTIVPIGRWVLDQACRQAADWHEHGHPLGMAVNVSARQLGRNAFVDEVRDALERSRLDPKALTLEITETTLMHNMNAAAERLTALKKLGVRIAIDDFGTGYSSLAYLRQFPVDALKIDRSFISTIADTKRSKSLIHTLVQLGKTLGLETLGEGIEDTTQLKTLQREQCDLGQGFLFARPLPVEAIEQFFDQAPPRGEATPTLPEPHPAAKPPHPPRTRRSTRN